MCQLGCPSPSTDSAVNKIQRFPMDFTAQTIGSGGDHTKLHKTISTWEVVPANSWKSQVFAQARDRFGALGRGHGRASATYRDILIGSGVVRGDLRAKMLVDTAHAGGLGTSTITRERKRTDHFA